MRRASIAMLALTLCGGAAHAQQSREITLFSNPGFSGARYTVTGPRTILDVPFAPRSAVLQGGGAWELCRGREYAGGCTTISANERDLRLGGGRLGSARPVGGAMVEMQWREVARLDVRDRADRDTASIRETTPFTQVQVCVERNAVRLRRAEVQFSDRSWQRLFLPLALTPGKCSDGVDLFRSPRRLRAIRFDYEAWSPGAARGTLIVRARPQPERRPR